jgi:acetyltransferase-like isoleucine patch superfamily enzyme
LNAGKLRKFFHLPLSNKKLMLSQLYWGVKTQLFYRFFFKKIGPGTVIVQPMFISNADCIEIGDHVLIRAGARLEAIRDPYGRTPSLIIGSNINIEQGVHIVCHNRIVIGKDVSIAGRCAIVDVTHPYEDINAGRIGSLIADNDSYVEVGDGAFLGYGAVILPNVRIGKRAVIGANAVVTHDVPEFSVVAGAPAKVMKVYSKKLQQWVKPVPQSDWSSG